MLTVIDKCVSMFATLLLFSTPWRGHKTDATRNNRMLPTWSKKRTTSLTSPTSACSTCLLRSHRVPYCKVSTILNRVNEDEKFGMKTRISKFAHWQERSTVDDIEIPLISYLKEFDDKTANFVLERRQKPRVLSEECVR